MEMAKKRQLQLGIISVPSNEMNSATNDVFERKLEYIKKRIEVAKASGKPLDLDIYSAPLGLGATVALGVETLFFPINVTQTITIRTPFPILVEGSQYQKFVEAIKNAFKTIYLS